MMWHLVAAAMLAGQGQGQVSPYHALENPPDPVAQRDELIALYDEICLRAFPDDNAAAAAAARHDATPLSQSDVRRFLRNDPGIGWQLRGRTGRFDVTIEQNPPYHTCGVRTMTANGFENLGPYRSLAASYEQGRGFRPVNPMDGVVEGVHVYGAGEQRNGPGNSAEALLMFESRASDAARLRGETAVEVRFAHQYVGGPEADGSGKPDS